MRPTAIRSFRSLGLAALLIPAVGAGNAGRTHAADGAVRWIRAATLRPSTLWIGGVDWAQGSSDSGRTWHDVTAALASAAQDSGCSFTRKPAVLDGPGKQVAIEETGGCTTASSSYVLVLYSSDGGKHWDGIGPTDPSGYGAGTAAPAFGAKAPYQAWLVDIGGNGDTKDVARLAGGSPRDGSNPATAIPGSQYDDDVTSLVPDPRGGPGVFADASGSDYNYVTYSTNGGNSWKLVSAPAGVKSFVISADPLVAGGLVAASDDQAFPPDRRWYSTNGGGHWSAGVCADDYKGLCPTTILPAAKPGGTSVAINKHGAYTFTSDAGASGRATISLPVPASHILDVQGDLRRGDPIYLLTGSQRIYRSLNGGSTWTILLP